MTHLRTYMNDLKYPGNDREHFLTLLAAEFWALRITHLEYLEKGVYDKFDMADFRKDMEDAEAILKAEHLIEAMEEYAQLKVQEALQSQTVSDDVIMKEAENYGTHDHTYDPNHPQIEVNIPETEGFFNGAIWMRDRLQNK